MRYTLEGPPGFFTKKLSLALPEEATIELLPTYVDENGRTRQSRQCYVRYDGVLESPVGEAIIVSVDSE